MDNTTSEHGRETAGELMALLEAAIALELNVSGLYGCYANAFGMDRDFWWKLSIEEKNHAALLRSGQLFVKNEIFPKEILCRNLEELESANREIKRLVQQFQSEPPSREEALRTALRLEESAGELHFQDSMENAPVSKVLEIFQKLNAADKGHAQRIREYMEMGARRP